LTRRPSKGLAQAFTPTALPPDVFARERPGSILHSGWQLPPHQQGRPGSGGVCQAGCAQGSALFQGGPDRLSQPANLSWGDAQKKILSSFHYALNQDGLPVSGQFRDGWQVCGSVCRGGQEMENLSTTGWRVAAPGHALLSAAPGRNGAPIRTRSPLTPAALPIRGIWRNGRCWTRISGRRAHQRRLRRAVHSWPHGQISRARAAGDASLNPLRMVRSRAVAWNWPPAVRKALAHQTPVRYEGLCIKTNGDTATVNLLVQPVTKPETAPRTRAGHLRGAPPPPRLEEKAAKEPAGSHDQRVSRVGAGIARQGRIPADHH